MTLRELRKINKLTQAEVAKKLKIHRTTYTRIENGISSLKVEQMKVLSKLYKVDLSLIYKIYIGCRSKRQEV